MGFREETRDWLEANCPQSMRTPGYSTDGGKRAVFANPDTKVWLDRMAERGWTVPAWPKEYGGGGLDSDQVRILREEMSRINARAPLFGHGVMMIGPGILEFGTDEQRLQHLPAIARGDIKWCQGYSEPNAGSDLASLQCRAVEDGDHYVLDGSKIWTSGADRADWMFCLIRTDPKASKHEGIAFILVDMESPGISTTPISLISGSSDFCQVFLDQVRVPKKNLIGEPGQGWTVSKRVMQYERASLGGVGGGRQKVRTLDDYAREYLGTSGGRISDAAMRERVLTCSMNDLAYQISTRRAAEEDSSNEGMAFMSSFFKYYSSEQNKIRTELLADILGTRGLGWSGEAFSTAERTATRAWLRALANSIEGGTSEVMLNVIAKRILGLPD